MSVRALRKLKRIIYMLVYYFYEYIKIDIQIIIYISVLRESYKLQDAQYEYRMLKLWA